MKKKVFVDQKPLQCPSQLRAIHDTMDILSGKWKITIIGCLNFGAKRFMDLQREVEGIGSKMLSKELQELEINGMISRTVLNTKPVTVQYAITEYGQTLRPIIWAMADWGQHHRRKIKSTFNADKISPVGDLL
jgi:DNA-binding HxlR family transcriptional regulator